MRPRRDGEGAAEHCARGSCSPHSPSVQPRTQSLRDPTVSLIGAPVLAADGASIGRVADIATAENGQIEAIRVRTGAALGFGERVVLIPQPAFMIKGGRVRLPDLRPRMWRPFLTLLPTAREIDRPPGGVRCNRWSLIGAVTGNPDIGK